jgi:hypothetical protein
MCIDAKTAQLILDVLTWNLQTWDKGYDFTEYPSEDVIQQAKTDFVKFCEFYGITEVEVPV